MLANDVRASAISGTHEQSIVQRNGGVLCWTSFTLSTSDKDARFKLQVARDNVERRRRSLVGKAIKGCWFGDRDSHPINVVREERTQ
jgi:hypothetical protein